MKHAFRVHTLKLDDDLSVYWLEQNQLDEQDVQLSWSDVPSIDGEGRAYTSMTWWCEARIPWQVIENLPWLVTREDCMREFSKNIFRVHHREMPQGGSFYTFTENHREYLKYTGCRTVQSKHRRTLRSQTETMDRLSNTQGQTAGMLAHINYMLDRYARNWDVVQKNEFERALGIHGKLPAEAAADFFDSMPGAGVLIELDEINRQIAELRGRRSELREVVLHQARLRSIDALSARLAPDGNLAVPARWLSNMLRGYDSDRLLSERLGIPQYPW